MVRSKTILWINFITLLCAVHSNTARMPMIKANRTISSTTNVSSELERQSTFHRRRRSSSSATGPCFANKIRPIVAYTEGSLILECSPCSTTSFSKAPVWEMRLVYQNGASLSLEDLEGHDVEPHDVNDCAITKVKPTLAGLYKCSFNGRVKGRYELIVLTVPEFKVVVADNIYPPPVSEGYTDPFMRWSEFSSCCAPSCESFGEQVSIGFCWTRTNDNQYTENVVPCNSKAAANRMSGKPNEKLFRPCFKRCQETVEEKTYKNKPELPPMVMLKLLFSVEGDSVELLCPGISVASYVEWKKDGELILQVPLHKGENEHMSINGYHSLHFHSLLMEQEGEYSCSHMGTKYGLFQLAVARGEFDTTEVESKLKYVGIGLTVLVVGGIGFTVFTQKKWGNI